MAWKKNEKIFIEEVMEQNYLFENGNKRGINIDKYALLIKYKMLNQSESKSLDSLFGAVTGQNLSSYNLMIYQHFKDFNKIGRDKKHGYMFTMFIDDCLKNQSVNEEKFNYFKDIVDTFMAPQFKEAFIVPLELVTSEYAPDLFKKHFPEKHEKYEAIKKEQSVYNLSIIINETINEQVKALNVMMNLKASDGQELTKEVLRENYVANYKLYSLSRFVLDGKELPKSLFKKDLTSSLKGKIGENLFSKEVNGMVVGHLGNKTDVETEEAGYSIKTTYAGAWNNHLAYLSGELYEKFKETSRVSSIAKDERFNDYVLNFFIGSKKESVDYLLLQKIKLNDLNNAALCSTTYHIPLSLIENTLKEKQYVFNCSELILLNEGEQYMKINFKQRSTKGQALVIATIDNMEQLFEKGLIEKNHINYVDGLSIKKKM